MSNMDVLVCVLRTFCISQLFDGFFWERKEWERGMEGFWGGRYRNAVIMSCSSIMNGS